MTKVKPTIILRLPSVLHITGLSRSTTYAMIAEGNFPRPIKLGKRAVGWKEADVAAWVNNRTQDTA
ncbi:helix-turn-helix transcriptional regulator [Oceaniglobus ichthyenteri]|uniref:helix-turn-helix transcriptional regulator n=1 Tax=Oceaniglobus ichthyenteri TaxID=2136177 RepID=UPI000D3B1EF4|nr:AlpA family transcriptional regulator [Oceaniglobus ichthyenteri]